MLKSVLLRIAGFASIAISITTCAEIPKIISAPKPAQFEACRAHVKATSQGPMTIRKPGPGTLEAECKCQGQIHKPPQTLWRERICRMQTARGGRQKNIFVQAFSPADSQTCKNKQKCKIVRLRIAGFATIALPNTTCAESRE